MVDKPVPMVHIEAWVYIPDDFNPREGDSAKKIEKWAEDEIWSAFDGVMNVESIVEIVHHTPDPGEGFIRENAIDNSSRTGIDGINDNGGSS